MEQIEENRQKVRVVFRIANIRRILADTMAYCTQLWIDNLIGTMGGPYPGRVLRDGNYTWEMLGLRYLPTSSKEEV